MATPVSVYHVKCDENKDLQQNGANDYSHKAATMNNVDTLSIYNTEFSAVNTSNTRLYNTDTNQIQVSSGVIRITDR